jgi:hypothetical protein
MRFAQPPFGLLFCALASFLFTGCNSVFNNLVDERIPQNASNIYTFSFQAKSYLRNVVPGTEQARLVINGEVIPMRKVEGREALFTADYQFPPNVREVRYYYELEYEYTNSGFRGETIKYSTHDNYGRPYVARLINRYPIQIVSVRGRTGDRINVVGTGFSEMDQIVVGGQEAETLFESPNALGFIVPPIPAGRSYPVELLTSGGPLSLGTFRVDQGALRVLPEAIEVASGDVTQVTFEIDGVAPSGGFRLTVTTDVPTSVIMPEVVIPAGARSTAVIIEGGAAGSGRIFVEAPGFGAREVPIRVY